MAHARARIKEKIGFFNSFDNFDAFIKVFDNINSFNNFDAFIKVFDNINSFDNSFDSLNSFNMSCSTKFLSKCYKCFNCKLVQEFLNSHVVARYVVVE